MTRLSGELIAITTAFGPAAKFAFLGHNQN